MRLKFLRKETINGRYTLDIVMNLINLLLINFQFYFQSIQQNQEQVGAHEIASTIRNGAQKIKIRFTKG